MNPNLMGVCYDKIAIFLAPSNEQGHVSVYKSRAAEQVINELSTQSKVVAQNLPVPMLLRGIS
jgi:hypothetical protein